MKTLFFGRQDCVYSQQAYNYLAGKNFQITPVWSRHRHDHAVPESFQQSWSGDYIVSYRSSFILKQKLLNKARLAAINFHPASVDYPGSGSYSWALYNQAKEFGSTVHVMTEQIDSGPIVEQTRWPVYESDTLISLSQRAQYKLYQLFESTIDGIVTHGHDYILQKLKQNRHIKWQGKAKRFKDLDHLQKIDPTIEQEHLQRIIKATHVPEYPPYIELHGKRFVYTP